MNLVTVVERQAAAAASTDKARSNVRVLETPPGALMYAGIGAAAASQMMGGVRLAVLHDQRGSHRRDRRLLLFGKSRHVNLVVDSMETF